MKYEIVYLWHQQLYIISAIMMKMLGVLIPSGALAGIFGAGSLVLNIKW